MRQKDFERIIANYQDVMESQVKRIEALKEDNERLKKELDAKTESRSNFGAELEEALVRFRTETLLFLRSLDGLCPTLGNAVQIPQDDYYLELARLTKPSAATMPDDELEKLIRDVGGVED